MANATHYNITQVVIQQCRETFQKQLQDVLEEPMRWIGMYIAAASAVCVLAMAADLFNGFRAKRFWFSCKYFSLNAFTLTLLAVSMKLPVDLTTAMFATCDWLAKLASLVFMLTALANFMPSLGSMTDQEILANVPGLSVFVVTVVANICIQVFQLMHGAKGYQSVVQWLMLAAAMLILISLVAFVSLAVMVLSTKRLIDSEYQEKHKAALNEEKSSGDIDTDSFQRALKRYWVMAETGSPQFVIARSAVCTASGAISLLSALGFCCLLVYIFGEDFSELFDTNSMYGWSTRWILCIQSVGVIVGSVAIAFRYFFSLRNESSDIIYKKCLGKCGFFVPEPFWTQRLMDWRDRTSNHIQIRNLTCRKYLHRVKWMVLNLVIGVQILVVGASKLTVFLSALPLSPFVYCFACIKKLIRYCVKQFSNQYSRDEKKLSEGFTSYVLLLEGEAKLPDGTLKSICQHADRVIERGRRNQLENLFSLLNDNMLGSFSGVKDFDSEQILSLCSQEPPYCWAMTLVTLASIAIALPNIPEEETKQLVLSLSEGLPLVKLIDTAIDTQREFSNIRGAAEVAWARVAMHSDWFDYDLKDTSHKGNCSKDVLQNLSNKATTIVEEFKNDAKDKKYLVANPAYWPFEVVAANAMYRISQTVLLVWDWSNDEALFQKLNVMIADIMAACLTNLEHVIKNRCHQNAIEEREKNVHEALLLLGKTEKTLQLLKQIKRPCEDPDKAMYIKEWDTSGF